MSRKMFTSTWRRRLRGGVLAAGLTTALALAGVGAGVGAAAPAVADQGGAGGGLHAPGTSEFKGVNWADPRDNYASDAVVPTGLHTTDSYQQVYAFAQSTLAGFRQNLGANTVRLPINPASVGTPWWNSYRGAIDAAADSGFKVILSYWEADSSKDGLIDDVPAWNTMWNTVVAEYQHTPNVYFEPMNEPHGYTLDQWVGVTSQWIADHRQVPAQPHRDQRDRLQRQRRRSR